MDVLLLAAKNKKTLQEHKMLKDKLQAVYGVHDHLYQKTCTKKMDVELQADLSTEFNIDVIIQDKKQFKYYTGLTPKPFLGFYSFLFLMVKLPQYSFHLTGKEKL